MPAISRRTVLGAGVALVLGRPSPARAQAGLRRVFVGTFTDGLGQDVPDYFGPRNGAARRGLHTFTFDTATGRAGDISLAAEVSNPFNLTMHPNGRVVYACRWPTQIDGQNLVTAFAVEGAALRELNTVRSGGNGPTVGVVDRNGRNLITTNFVTSSIVCFRLRADGSLGERSALIGSEPGAGGTAAAPAGDAPGGPHAVALSATERFAIVPEIQANRCRVLRFDVGRGSLETHQLAADLNDAGPRHLAWHPGHRYLYTAGESGSSISAWRWDEDRGELAVLQNLTTRPDGFTGSNQPADISMHPSGSFVYVTNRGAGTLAGFRIDPSSGRLSPVGPAVLGSPSSWSMLFDPGGRWALAAAQIGDEVVVYSVDQRSGRLTPTGQTLEVGSPISIRLA